MQTVEISFIVPAYNDQDTLEAQVNDALNQLRNRFTTSEVIIVNDGSLDSTAQIANQLAAVHPDQVRVVHLNKNQGFEAALKSGVSAAKGENILFRSPHH